VNAIKNVNISFYIFKILVQCIILFVLSLSFSLSLLHRYVHIYTRSDTYVMQPSTFDTHMHMYTCTHIHKNLQG